MRSLLCLLLTLGFSLFGCERNPGRTGTAGPGDGSETRATDSPRTNTATGGEGSGATGTGGTTPSNRNLEGISSDANAGGNSPGGGAAIPPGGGGSGSGTPSNNSPAAP